LSPAETVTIGDPKEDPFIPIGKHYRSGTFLRPTIFVCDIPDARLHMGPGMVCTRDWEVVADLEYRVGGFPAFRKRKPRNVTKLEGGYYTTINFWNATNVGHWLLDCLPRLHSLAKAEPHQKLTLLMPESLSPLHRESLDYVLPRHFAVEYHPDDAWFQVEHFKWASMVSGRCNFLMPTEYYEAVRQPIFARLGLASVPDRSARLYLSRRSTKQRRVLNEDEVCRLLTRYGFEIVEMEKFSFRKQVELIHSADIVVGPHGAALNWMLFAGKIRLVELHPTRAPLNHCHTLAKGLGQEYHFLTDSRGEDDDFTVDVPALETLLEGKLALRPR
jgi:capsular polysaccharide biosynthesis protein